MILREYEVVEKPNINVSPSITYVFLAYDSPRPVATMFPSHTFHEGRCETKICVLDLLYAKVDAIVK